MTPLTALLTLLSLLCLGLAGYAMLGRGPRATEGRLIALVVPLLALMAVTALNAKRDDLAMGSRIDINRRDVDPVSLADATGISTALAGKVLAYRDARPGRTFRSL